MENEALKILAKLTQKAPSGPGVYRFLDEAGKPIYVGKAKSLKHRLQSYVRASAKHGIKTIKMLEGARSVEWTETNSEVEALILEDNLIKALSPKYNVLLKDDKTFQYIKVTVQNDYPEILTVRKITKDGAKYFGPKTSGSDVLQLVESAKRIFRLCSQHGISVDPGSAPLIGAKVAVKVGGVAAKRPCLDYHIRRCTGPCAGVVTPQEYRQQIDQALRFLSGDYGPAIEALKAQMAEFAAQRKFERAAALRDQIGAIERSAQKQLITDTSLAERDVIAYVEDLGKHYFVLFQIRGGKLIAQEKFVSEGGLGSVSGPVSATGEDAVPDPQTQAETDTLPREVMGAFVRDYYSRAADIPREVLVSVELEEGAQPIEDYLRQQSGRAVTLLHPQRGHKDDLVALAEKNARSFAQQSRVRWMADERKGEKALEELAKALSLPEAPKRMECYDISHLGGTETIGSMVVFKKGEPATADYRQFRLRSTANQNDDFKSMEEVITRRLNYLEPQLPEGYRIRKAKKEDEEFILKTSPDLKDFDYDLKQFQVLEKGSGKKAEPVGFGRAYDLSEKVTRISSPRIAPAERGRKLGHFLLRAVIEKAKAKRFYLLCDPSLEDYYLKFGFETLREPPVEMKEIYQKTLELTKGQKGKPLYMAYQKKKKDPSFGAWPDLMVIDGGKGQLSAAHQVLESRGLKIPMISLAKKQEEVYLPHQTDPIDLPKTTEANYLLQRLRDEAHRFAITANRSSREKTMVKSALDTIPGVGPKLKKKLLTVFGSVAHIKAASDAQLEQVAGEAVAKRLREGL